MEYILIWFGCGVLSAIVASGKNRSVLGWFVLGFLFGPFGFIASLVVSSSDTNSISTPYHSSVAANNSTLASTDDSAHSNERALLTKFGIVKNRDADGGFTYRVNGRELKSLEMAIRVADEKQKPQPQYKQCPYCAEDIRLEAKICRFCDRELGSSD